ncbi:hypothetical protein CPLU01_12213 [Colletotrichum plurivorum]|uniref:Uncharacterized protein n=1 Tax=Colletotrichum plurivorum TaxID=2175906 RepID=A0A8H6N7A8_9PEZI|nr:hypothetical protein CPLU01_12213 [Colletotrichum plurivorum]
MGDMSGTGGVHDELGADAKLFGDAARERGAIGLKRQRGGLWLDAMIEDGDVVFEERRATMLWTERHVQSRLPAQDEAVQMHYVCKQVCTSRAGGARRRLRPAAIPLRTAKSGRRGWTASVGFNAGSCEAHDGAPEDTWVLGSHSLPVARTEEHDDINSHLSMLAPSRVGSAVTMPTAATTIAVTPLSGVDTRRKTGCEDVGGGRDAPISKPQGGVSATASFWCGPAVFAEEKAEGYGKQVPSHQAVRASSSSPTNIEGLHCSDNAVSLLIYEGVFWNYAYQNHLAVTCSLDGCH